MASNQNNIIMNIFLALALALLVALPVNATTEVSTYTNEGILPYQEICLNGQWELAISEVAPEVFAAHQKVPGVITMANPSLGQNLDALDLDTINYNYVWYRKVFKLDNGLWDKAILSLRAKYNAQVYLNGKLIAYDHHSSYSHGFFDLSQAINYGGENVLLVRVGSWNTSSSPSKDNSSEWWRNSRAPGIWDDVTIRLSGKNDISHIKIIPSVENANVECTVTVDAVDAISAELRCEIYDDTLLVSKAAGVVVLNGGKSEHRLSLDAGDLKTWSAGKEGNPKLNLMVAKLIDKDGKLIAQKQDTFGYRDIKVEGKNVIINGKKVLFRAENIAFCRAVNRWADCVFSEEWIRKFLTAAVQDYNLNYLRIHLGHAYSKWYKVADEVGMMLHDEWRFMHDDEPTGSDLLDTEVEFHRWISQNVNHPSIVAWDQENEGNVELTDLKKELRAYDPSRIWAEDDFDARHIYEYSENVVTGFDSYVLPTDKPGTVLESCRLWINEFGLLEPREDFKTSRTASGWNIFYYTKEDIARLLSDIHTDVGTFYRSRRLQAWAPFALLSGKINGHNFFIGDLADSLTAQPNLKALGRLNEPIGVSVEMNQAREWYKDVKVYRPGSSTSKRIWVWNDLSYDTTAKLIVSIEDSKGNVTSQSSESIHIPAYEAVSYDTKIRVPSRKGPALLRTRLELSDGNTIEGVDRRLMVASNAKSVIGIMAFGGRRSPVEGAYSILEHFTKSPIAESIQKKVIELVGGGLLDKLDIRGTSENPIYNIQSTIYESPTKLHISRYSIDASANVLSAEYAEALPFISLSDATRRTIVDNINAVPEDEARIIRKEFGKNHTYEITMVGTGIKYCLEIAQDGTLITKTILE